MSFAGIMDFITWQHLLDIVLVGLVFYNVLLLIRGTRAVQMLLGMLLIVGIYYVAGRFELNTLHTILENFLILLPFVIVVLFQQEIRRTLARFGRNPLWGFRGSNKAGDAFQEIVLASTHLASKKIGALIVVERLEGLRSFSENGIELDAVLSLDLLINIFNPDSPLHDGAVIVQGERIVAAACFLPLSLSAELASDLGTRHRAALAITTETDAVAVVVSEETGTISAAFNGKLVRSLDANGLRTKLYKHLITDLHPKTKRPPE